MGPELRRQSAQQDPLGSASLGFDGDAVALDPGHVRSDLRERGPREIREPGVVPVDGAIRVEDHGHAVPRGPDAGEDRVALQDAEVHGSLAEIKDTDRRIARVRRQESDPVGPVPVAVPEDHAHAEGVGKRQDVHEGALRRRREVAVIRESGPVDDGERGERPLESNCVRGLEVVRGVAGRAQEPCELALPILVDRDARIARGDDAEIEGRRRTGHHGNVLRWRPESTLERADPIAACVKGVDLQRIAATRIRQRLVLTRPFGPDQGRRRGSAVARVRHRAAHDAGDIRRQGEVRPGRLILFEVKSRVRRNETGGGCKQIVVARFQARREEAVHIGRDVHVGLDDPHIRSRDGAQVQVGHVSGDRPVVQLHDDRDELAEVAELGERDVVRSLRKAELETPVRRGLRERTELDRGHRDICHG